MLMTRASVRQFGKERRLRFRDLRFAAASSDERWRRSPISHASETDLPTGADEPNRRPISAENTNPRNVRDISVRRRDKDARQRLVRWQRLRAGSAHGNCVSRSAKREGPVSGGPRARSNLARGRKVVSCGSGANCHIATLGQRVWWLRRVPAGRNVLVWREGWKSFGGGRGPYRVIAKVRSYEGEKNNNEHFLDESGRWRGWMLSMPTEDPAR